MFIGSCKGTLHAVDRRTGAVHWTFDARQDGGKPEFHGCPLVTSTMIIVATDDRRPEGVGHVYAFDRATLALLGKYRAGAGVMTDIVEWNGTVFFLTLDDELVALDLRTGTVRWTFRTGAKNDDFAVNSTPALTRGRIVIGGLNGTIHALDARTGAVVWHRELGSRISTSIVALGSDLYAGDDAGCMHRLDASTGETVAQVQIPGSLMSIIVPADSTLVVYSHDDDGVVTLHSIPASLETTGWTRDTDPPGWSSFARPYVSNSSVVAGRETGEFVGLRLSDGRVMWSGKVAGSIAGIGGDDSWLYLGTRGGTLYGYRLHGGEAH